MQQTARQRSRKKRLIAWVIVYLLLFAGFLALVIWQSRRVNTLDFPNGQLQLTVSKTKYTAGDTVTYTLKNGLTNAITLVNKCPGEPLHVYEWENNQWVRIHEQASTSVCATQPKLVSIPSGGSLTKNYANWPKLFAKPGIYRLVAFADNYTALPYVDFQVVAKPTPPPAPQVIYKPVYTPVYTPIYIPTVPTGGGDGGGGGGDN